ncbi:trichohyalin-like isoform X4 [Ostrea edulis]|uniref:trichohyalin-like isoform X4 n=1 Tax=Ostrea edulis TaxID=37623 RepID=UPI0024AEEFB6|nr:trichohyalin-like isoform X4 [Ostrea edulis]
MSRNNGYGSYRGSSREIRPPSAELVDLHVYIVPPDIWRERYNNFLNQNVTETISAGIIRVHPERLVYDLRDELDQQVGVEMLPRDYVFLKSVGRSITRLKQKQEYQLKAKHFIPPQAYAPELYLLEISADDRESSRTSTRPQSPYSQNPESEDERRSGNKSKHRNNESSPYRYSPLPKIKPTHSPPHRVEYNHNGDIKTENGRLSDSWGSNRDKRTPPPPRSVPRTPTRPKVSREFTPRNQTPREESHRAPPRSSPSPTDHRKRANQNQEPGSGTYTNHTNEDSGINVNSPEDHFDALDRRKQDEDRNDDLHRRLHPENDEHRRNGEEDNDEWERRRREDEERRRREEEERRRREEEEQRREEEERRRLEEERARISKQQLTGSDEGHQYQQIPSSAFTKNSLNFNEGGDPSVNPTSVNYSKEQNSTTVDNSVYGGKHRMKVPGGNKDLVNTYNKDRERSLQNPENSMNYNKERLKVPEMDLNRFPSPPPLQMNDSNEGHDTESSKQNRKAENAPAVFVTKHSLSKQETKKEIKERLLKELEAAREARRAVEKQREELVKKAKLMQTKTQNRRNHDMMNIFDARDIWKKRYFEEKKKTPPLEEQCNRLRHELDIIHRKLMNTLEGPSKDKSTKHGDLKPSQKVGDKQEPGQFYPANYRNTGQAPPYNQNYEDGLIRQGYQRALLNNTTENYQEYQPHHANNYYNGQVIPRKMGSPKLPPISPQSKKSSRPSSYYDQTNTYRSPLNSAYHRPYSYQPPTKSGSRFSSPNSVSPNARGNFRSPASSGKSVRFEPSRRNSRGINYY